MCKRLTLHHIKLALQTKVSMLSDILQIFVYYPDNENFLPKIHHSVRFDADSTKSKCKHFKIKTFKNKFHHYTDK